MSPRMLTRTARGGNYGQVECAPSAMAEWQFKKESPHGHETRDRQQELFVVVDAALGGAARQQHRLRRGFHPALYRRSRQATAPEFQPLGQGAVPDRRRRHGMG